MPPDKNGFTPYFPDIMSLELNLKIGAAKMDEAIANDVFIAIYGEVSVAKKIKIP